MISQALRRIARTRSAAGDADDGVVVVDLDVEAVGAEVHRHRLPRLDHAQRAGCARGGLGFGDSGFAGVLADRSEEHPSELQSLMRISYAVCCLKKKIIVIQK